MKKKLVMTLMALAAAAAITGCAGKAEAEQPEAEETTAEPSQEEEAEPAEEEEAEPVEEETAPAEVAAAIPEGVTIDNPVNVLVDGAPVSEAGFTFDELLAQFQEYEIGETVYYGVKLAELADVSSAQGAFVEATDGFVMYMPDASDLTLAAFQGGGEAYEPITLEEANAYAVVAADGTSVSGASNIYFVSTPCDFEVDIQVNGASVGKLTRQDFMKKTPMGEEKVPTSMFDGSFKYNQGSSTYSGKFLGIDYETMLAKLDNLDGVDFEGEITEVEYYGTPGMGEPGKNTEYALYPDEDTYFGAVDFFCMYDGMTKNPEIKDVPMGLSVFSNGGGSRWLTYSLTAINIITA